MATVYASNNDLSRVASESLERSMLRSPWLTVCNVLWGNRLAASRHTIGSRPVPFSSLWPGQNFVELYQHGGMENSVYEIVKLLLVSSTFGPLNELLNNKFIAWDTKFPGDVTLTHLVCSLNSAEGLNRLLKDSPQSGVWEIRDHLDNDPFSVCFSPNLRKNLRKNFKYLNNKRNKSPVSVDEPMTPQIRSQIFNLASESEGLYYLTILLQMYDFDIHDEKDSNGNSLLHVAASGGLPCLAHIFYLVEFCRADITQPNDEGLTPVHIAAMIGDEKLTEVLICVFGVGVNSCDTVKKWTPLHFAVRYNCPQLIDMLLERGADLRKDDSDGCIPSLVAQKYSSVECLNLLQHHTNNRDQLLLQQASEGTLNVRSLYPSDFSLVSSDGFTLLMKAVLGNQPELVRGLLSQVSCPKDFRQFKLPGPNEIPSIKEQSRKTALIMAAESGLINCLRILLEADADPTIEDSLGMKPLHYAVENNHKDCVRCILNHPKGLSGLKLAVSLAEKNERGDIAHITREAMVKRHKEVVTPNLFAIAQSGEKDELFHLLEDGDDVNPSNDVSDWPFYVACSFGHFEVVKLLSESGANVVKRHRLNLCTPLHVAARGGHTEVVRFLLGFCHPLNTSSPPDPAKAYFDVNEKNAMQETPLELAACQGHMNVVRLLLDHGAVTTLPDSNSSLLSCPAFCGIQFLIESRRKEQMDKIVRYLKEQKPLKDFTTLWKGPSDFNLRDTHGDTVLMVAAKHAKPDVMDFLLQSAVLYTADMRIKWNYNKRSFRPLPSGAVSPNNSGLEESLPSELPSRRRDDVLDYRPQTAAVFESSLGRRSRGGSYMHHTTGRRGGGGGGDDTSEDDDLSLSNSFHSRYNPVTPNSPANRGDDRQLGPHPPPAASNYVNVVPKGTGPCTQSGLLCLINTHDRCTVLHRAVEGNQFKLIPLLLANDPNIADLQDKNSQSALHRACQSNSKKCIQALCGSSVSIDATLRDVNNNLAEDLAIQPKLKKLVQNYRAKQAKENLPTNRPLPPAPLNDPSLVNGNPPLDPRHQPHPPNPEYISQSPIAPQYEQQNPANHGGHGSYQYTRPNPGGPSSFDLPSNTSTPNRNNGQTNHLLPSPLSPTIEEDSDSGNSPPQDTRRRQPQPRYIVHQPRNQIIGGNGNQGRYNRVVHHRGSNGGSVSDDGCYNNYSRLNYRGNAKPTGAPPIPHQARINARVNEIRRNLTFEESESPNESDD